MKLLIKNKIEIIQNTRFVFFFSNTVSLFFSTTVIDWLLFVFVFLARAFVESNMCLLQQPQNNAVARLHSQHMNWWWLSLWTPSNLSRDLNSAPLRNQSTILNVDDGLQPFSHETLWQLCWFHQDSQSEKLEEGLIPETFQALLISHNSLLGAINTFLCITVNCFFLESTQWQHIWGWMKALFVWPKRMSFSTLVLFSGWPGSLQHVWIYGGCQSPQLWEGGLVLVRHSIWNHRNHITVTFNRFWPPPFMKWVAHHATSCDPSFLDDISLSSHFPSSNKCIWLSSYFLQILHQPLVSLFPS